jgi:hypothetical protein
VGINFSKKSTGDDVEKGRKDATATAEGGKGQKATKMPVVPSKAKLNETKRPTQHTGKCFQLPSFEVLLILTKNVLDNSCAAGEPSKYQDERGTCDCGAPVPYKGMTCAEQGKTCY